MDGIARSRDWLTPLELIALGAIWGGSFLCQRIAAADFGSFPLVEARLLLGSVILLPFLWRARHALTLRHWANFALVGALNSAIPFVLFAWAAGRAPAGVGAIANSMTVLFAALVGFAAYGERIGLLRAIALLAGFAGVVVLASGRTAGGHLALPVLAGVAGALCYGIAVNLTRQRLADVPPVAAVAGTLGCSTLMVLPPALASWPASTIPPVSWLAAGVLYFRLIQRVGAARAATSTYLVPIFGIAWAWLLLGERPTTAMLASAALIVGSVILSQREAAAKPARTARHASKRSRAGTRIVAADDRAMRTATRPGDNRQSRERA
jgi:drug/metabolite transporter (DMT)-like permease